MARPVKYTADQFDADIDAFIEYCNQTNAEPDDYNLMQYLKISPSTLDRYRAGDNEDSNNTSSFEDRDKSKYKGFGSALKKIEHYREHYALEQVKKDPKLAGHVAFKLKQQRWGGWSDKQESSVTGDIKVKMTTTGGKSFD